MSVQAAPQLEKPRKRTSAALYEVVVPLLATAAGFLVWEAICKAFNVPAYLVPAPSEILKDTLAIGPTVFGHSMATLKTVLLGFVVLGVATGLRARRSAQNPDKDPDQDRARQQAGNSTRTPGDVS